MGERSSNCKAGGREGGGRTPVRRGVSILFFLQKTGCLVVHLATRLIDAAGVSDFETPPDNGDARARARARAELRPSPKLRSPSPSSASELLASSAPAPAPSRKGRPGFSGARPRLSSSAGRTQTVGSRREGEARCEGRTAGAATGERALELAPSSELLPVELGTPPSRDLPGGASIRERSSSRLLPPSRLRRPTPWPAPGQSPSCPVRRPSSSLGLWAFIFLASFGSPPLRPPDPSPHPRWPFPRGPFFCEGDKEGMR